MGLLIDISKISVYFVAPNFEKSTQYSYIFLGKEWLNTMIKVEHLIKQYGDRYAVNDISFEVKKGEIVGFLGPNGAGKSTTMNILT